MKRVSSKASPVRGSDGVEQRTPNLRALDLPFSLNLAAGRQRPSVCHAGCAVIQSPAALCPVCTDQRVGFLGLEATTLNSPNAQGPPQSAAARAVLTRSQPLFQSGVGSDAELLWPWLGSERALDPHLAPSSHVESLGLQPCWTLPAAGASRNRDRERHQRCRGQGLGTGSRQLSPALQGRADGGRENPGELPW